MKDHYPNEKFTNAVHTLATSPESLQDRIRDAYVYHIIHVRAETVERDLQHRVRELHKALTKVDTDGNEGSVAATTSRMSTIDAIEVAREIVALAHEIRSSLDG